MSERQIRYMCKPCGRVFTGKVEAQTHARRHRTKAYNSVIGEQKVKPEQLVREIEIEVTESEELTLYEIAESEPPEEPESRIISEPNEPTDTQRSTLWDYGKDR